MELELGLKITRTREDVSSSVDFRFSKDPFGPLVLSRETDSRFIIIIHLKGFKKESIEIEINKEGDRITIRGRKAVEEMVLIRWMAWRKEVELRVFKKVFLIPDIVDLDKIKARFDDDDSTLTITIPKRVKGISGFKIEEERVDFGDVSVENREEIKNVEECEEENVERGKSDEHSERFETESQREEEFIMEDKERETQVLGEEEETEDDNLEKIHQIEEQDKILEFIPDIEEEENKQEKQVSEVKAKSDGFGSRAFEEEEPDELGKTKAQEFEFGKVEADDEVKKIHELVEKKQEEDENAKIGEEEFEGPKRRGKQEKMKELVEEAEKYIADDTRKPVQEIEDTLERKHKEKKINEPARCEKESKTRELEKTKTNDQEKEKKEIAETETKEQQESYSRPKILEKQEISEKKTEFGVEERERRNEESKIQETVQEKRVEEKKKKKKTVKMDIKNGVSVGENDIAETEEFESEKIDEMVEKKEDEEKVGQKSEGIKLQEQQEPARCKTLDLVKSKTNDQETETETKEQESHRPKILGEEEIAEKKSEFCQKKSVPETIAEIDKSRKVEEIEEQQVDKQFKKLIGGEISDRRDVNHEKKTIETDKGIRNSATEAQEIEKKDSGIYGKEEDMVQENYQNEHEQEKKEKADKPQKKTATIEQELVNLSSQLEQDNIHEELLEEKAKDCQEDESETKTDDVVRKVQGNKEQDLYEPKRDHVRKIKELVQDKIAESQIEAECGGLSNVHSSGVQELHEPKIHKERDKTPLTEAEEPSGQKKEEDTIVESETITENEKNSIEKVQEMKEGRPEKPESHEKRYKIQQVVEADHKEEQGEEKVISKQENDELKRSMVQETGEIDKTRAMKETEIVERRTKTRDGSLSNDGDPGLSKPYKRQEEDKIQELVEMGTSDYREKLNKQDVDHLLRSQAVDRPDLDEFEEHGKQSNIPPLVEEEKVEEIAEPKEKLEDDHSGKFHEFEERKPYEDWTYEEQEKRKDLVKEEATNRRDQHSDGAKVIAKAELKTEEDSSNNVLQEIGKQEYHELQRSMVQDKIQETEEKGKGRAMEGNEIVERRQKNKDGSFIQEGEEDTELGELERHCKQRKSQQQSVEDEMGEGNKEKISEPSGKMEGDDSSGKFHEFQKSYEDWKQEGSEEAEYLAKEEITDPKDEHKGKHEEKRYERVSQAKRKVEDEINEKVCKDGPESDKQEQIDKMEGLLGEGASDGEKEGENLVNDFTTKIQEMEQEESHDIVQGFVEDKTEDQEHEKAEVAATVVAKNENGSSRKVQTTVNEQELEGSGKHKDQTKIPQTSDPKGKEEDEEIVSKKDTKEQETHVQELQGKTENCKDDDEDKRKQGKTVETMSPERFKTKHDDGIVRNIQATKVQESNDKKNQEPEDKIEELEKKETSNHEVKLVTEDDDDKLTKGQEFLEKESSNVSTRRPVEQEEFQELKEVEKRGDGEKAEAETKIEDGNPRKFETSKMLELDESEENEEQKKIRKPMEEKNEDIAEEKIQDNIERRIKDQEIKGQKPFELHKNGDNDKIPEPIVERRRYHRDEEKGMEERQTEETKRRADNVSSRKKSHQIEDELEKASEIQESVEQTIQEHGYKEPSKTKSMEDSREYQDVEEKRSDQEPMVEEEGIEKGEQKEKTERIPQVKPKANDDSSRKNEFEEQESTRLREQKERVKHQGKMVERETNDQSKEEKTEAEYELSRKVQDNEEEKSEKLGETSNRKEGKERNRAVWRGETKTRDDGCRKVKEIEEQEKKQTLVKKDLAGQAKEKKDQETKDSSRNVKEDEKQESDEHKRNEEQDIEESVKGDKDNESINKEVEAKPEDHESKRHVGLKEQDKTRELVQQKTDEETAKTETKTKDNEPSKMQEMKEQETSEQRRLEEQERVKKLVDEFEDGNMKKIKEIEKEEPTEPERDEKRGKIQEPVVVETSEDDEEEDLEIEFEDSEEDWEAEVIQEMDTDEDNDEIRQIKRIKLGFRLVGGSALFMSLIVIVISFIRSKKKIRCYKF